MVTSIGVLATIPSAQGAAIIKVTPAGTSPSTVPSALFPRERVPSPKVHAFVEYLRERLRFVERGG
ncbi:hypothetical protein [Paraburkholderia sp. RAU2J]|uniref:hypothetical protein n=1 Tax=Paraburkholderia sp. RAU2J TaxID=1938810 RepID=UPI000EAFA887|nr:hypothetical protein [Paraburkholderia sp. RAU2J]